MALPFCKRGGKKGTFFRPLYQGHWLSSCLYLESTYQDFKSPPPEVFKNNQTRYSPIILATVYYIFLWTRSPFCYLTCKYTRSMLILLKMLILLFCRLRPFHYAKKKDKTKRKVWSLTYHTQWELKDKVSKRQMCMPKYQGAIHKNVSLAFSHTYQTCNAPRKYVL